MTRMHGALCVRKDLLLALFLNRDVRREVDAYGMSDE